MMLLVERVCEVRHVLGHVRPDGVRPLTKTVTSTNHRRHRHNVLTSINMINLLTSNVAIWVQLYSIKWHRLF